MIEVRNPGFEKFRPYRRDYQLVHPYLESFSVQVNGDGTNVKPAAVGAVRGTVVEVIDRFELNAP